MKMRQCYHGGCSDQAENCCASCHLNESDPTQLGEHLTCSSSTPSTPAHREKNKNKNKNKIQGQSQLQFALWVYKMDLF